MLFSLGICGFQDALDNCCSCEERVREQGERVAEGSSEHFLFSLQSTKRVKRGGYAGRIYQVKRSAQNKEYFVRSIMLISVHNPRGQYLTEKTQRNEEKMQKLCKKSKKETFCHGLDPWGHALKIEIFINDGETNPSKGTFCFWGKKSTCCFDYSRLKIKRAADAKDQRYRGNGAPLRTLSFQESRNNLVLCLLCCSSRRSSGDRPSFSHRNRL